MTVALAGRKTILMVGSRYPRLSEGPPVPRSEVRQGLSILCSILGILTIGFCAAGPNHAFAASFTPETALEQCDALAAHPDDPDRYLRGVPDDQLAPGPAIEACAAAVKLNPDLGRAWFQLGRVY